MNMKHIPFDDTLLTISNYKEPLRPVPKGHGYLGTIAFTKDKKLIQCHVCGTLHKQLGTHIRTKHGLRAESYKQMFQLSPTTALISEDLRMFYKNNTLRWLQQLSPKEKDIYLRNQRNAHREWWSERKKRPFYQPKIQLETKNKRGTCPDQLLEKIAEVARKIGYTPSLAEFIRETGSRRYVPIIFETFGSWNKALSMGKFLPHPKKKSGGFVRRYDDEELLEYLRIYVETHKKIPTETDCKRGLIPSAGCYQRFGGIPKARELAGIEMPPLKKGWKGGYERPTVQAVLESV